MTDAEKKTAEILRAEGYTYSLISKKIGVSINTVKAHIYQPED